MRKTYNGITRAHFFTKYTELNVIAQNLFICPSTLSQYAALEAFDLAYLQEVRTLFKQRRDALYEALAPIFNIDAKPQGAFYLWADISKYSNDGFEFAKKMLEDIHVAVTPGIDFGSQKHYIRFAYTREIPHMFEGVERIKKYLVV